VKSLLVFRPGLIGLSLSLFVVFLKSFGRLEGVIVYTYLKGQNIAK